LPSDQQRASTIDTASFAAALSAGDLDACVLCLRVDPSLQLDAAERNCRLAEALFHCARRDDAIECSRRAFDLAGDHSHVLDFCAWLFSNCGRNNYN
jgi:hypothetical protein